MRSATGTAFAEALARGLPCVARTAYAMPEIVTPGVSGALFDGEDPHALAKAIVAVGREATQTFKRWN